MNAIHWPSGDQSSIEAWIDQSVTCVSRPVASTRVKIAESSI